MTESYVSDNNNSADNIEAPDDHSADSYILEYTGLSAVPKPNNYINGLEYFVEFLMTKYKRTPFEAMAIASVSLV